MKATKVEILRESITRIVPILSGRGVFVTQIGMKAYVKYDNRTKQPEVVNIPYVPDNAPDELITAIQGFIDHEVAHVLYSEAKYIEAAMASKVAGLAGILEDTFIERKMKQAFAGSKTNLVQTWQFVQEKLISPHLNALGASATPDQLFGTLLVPLMRMWSGQKECEAFLKPYMKDLEPFINVIGDDLIAEIPNISCSKDSFTLAVKIHNRLEELKRRKEEEERKRSESTEESGEADGDPCEDGSSSGDSSMGGDTSPPDDEGSSDPESGDAEDEAGDAEDEAGGGTGGDSDEDDADATTDEENDGDGKGDDEESADDETEESGADDADDEDEVDEAALDTVADAIENAKDMDDMMSSIIKDAIEDTVRSSSYTPLTKDFDEIAEFKPASAMATQDYRLRIMNEQVKAQIAPLQRHLERCVAAKSHSRHISGYRSGRINPTALHRIVTGDERLFRRKVISRTKDAAISLVVDLSGSMSGSKVELAMQTAFAMSTSLDRLNITHEVIGFTTHDPPTYTKDGRSVREVIKEVSTVKKPSRIEPIYMPIFKPFNARLTTDRQRSMASYDEISLRNNTDGESIEYAARRLAGRRESRKIMIVLSDGCPWGGEGSIAEQAIHLKNTVRRLSASNIEMFGIGIMDNSVQEFYPESVVIHNLTELPSTLMRSLEAMLLKSAA